MRCSRSVLSVCAAAISVLIAVPVVFARPHEITVTPGAQLRVRHEYLKNVFDQENAGKDNRNYFRVRTNIWTDVGVTDTLHLFARLANEFRPYTYLYQASTGKKRPVFDINETVIDTLYLDMMELAGGAVDLRLGRQDFSGEYGDGFLIADGTPLDGSRTHYFNAAKLIWHLSGDSSLDLAGLVSERAETFLPVVNESDPKQALNVTDERAFFAYYKNATWKDLPFETYYIYKWEDDAGGVRMQAQKGRIHTLGYSARSVLPFCTLRHQLAGQIGSYGSADRQGVGGYLFADKGFDQAFWKPKVSVGVIYLSGDDPSTERNEAWDPLFSRYPWMSELYSLSYGSESGTSYWTNLSMFRTVLEASPLSAVKTTLGYNYLRANESVSGVSFSTGSGKERGHLFQGKVSYSLSKNVSCYVLAEYLLPGDFYGDDADPSLFVRTEVKLTY